MVSFRCYDISDVIPTDHNKFSSVSNTIVVAIFPIFFFLRDIVYAQTWEVLTMKNRLEPPHTESPSQPFLVSSRTLKTAATITSVGCYTAGFCVFTQRFSPQTGGKYAFFWSRLIPQFSIM